MSETKKNFETLEAGKSYEDTEGNAVRVTGNMRGSSYPFSGDNGHTYTAEGYIYNDGEEHHRDLVKLLGTSNDEATAEEPRHEVTPGTDFLPLVVGKRYYQRNGDIVTITGLAPADSTYAFTTDRGWRLTSEGHYLSLHPRSEHEKDIVSVVVEGIPFAEEITKPEQGTKPSLEVQLGRKYRSRGGEIREIVSNTEKFPHIFKSDTGLTFRPDGRFMDDDYDSVHDLMELVEDQPVTAQAEPSPEQCVTPTPFEDTTAGIKGAMAELVLSDEHETQVANSVADTTLTMLSTMSPPKSESLHKWIVGERYKIEGHDQHKWARVLWVEKDTNQVTVMLPNQLLVWCSYDSGCSNSTPIAFTLTQIELVKGIVAVMRDGTVIGGRVFANYTDLAEFAHENAMLATIVDIEV